MLGYVEGGSPFKFFLGVFMVAVPFWLIGQYADLELLPGLPVSSLAVFCPVTVAAVLVYTAGGGGALVELLKRSFDVERIGSKIWYLPAGLLVPGIAFGMDTHVRLSFAASMEQIKEGLDRLEKLLGSA